LLESNYLIDSSDSLLCRRKSPCLAYCKNGKPQDAQEYCSADNFEDLPWDYFFAGAFLFDFKISPKNWPV
jgi:hypothetical protein